MMLSIRLTIVLSMSLYMCASYAESTAFKVLSVSNYNYTLKEKAAVIINIGESDTNHCALTMLRSSVTKGYIAESTKRSDGSFDIDCYWNGSYFVDSSNHKTFKKLSIISIDMKSKTAELETSLKLVDPNTKKYLEFNGIKISVTGQQFKNLMIK